MACSVRIYNSIFSHNFVHKNKYLPLLLCNRRICSKDDDSNTKNSSSIDSSEKPKEIAKKSSTKSKTSRSKVRTKPISDEQKEVAKQKLMSLLSEITVTSDSPIKSESKLNIAKAVKRITKKERLERMEAERMTPEKEMKMAVKTVASNFKTDAEKVESELNEKLSTLDLSKEEEPEEIKDIAEDTPLIDEKLSANLMSSVEEVADTISENPIPPRSELTKRLLRLSLDQKIKSESMPMRSVIEGMIIKSQQPSPLPPAEEKTQRIDDRRMGVKKFPMTKIERENLFSFKPLNIFDPSSEIEPDSSNTFWQKLQEREVRLMTHFAPSNSFEEMIMWTEQGKHWKFPIDNETEMGDEEKVGFHEHVFLEHHLKGFPTKGPIRHFMELVCVGLSKNPYITVERKVENIEWFRNYFSEKEEILRDAGVLD